jgi:ubiquinone/menaquinone biosynthesis C-methylase UbiE
MVGLNIDYEGSHASIRELLRRAGVEEQCSLIQSDARFMPFYDGSFDSVSCFLGLQDIEIGFGQDGLQATMKNALRVTKKGGKLFFIDREETIRNASPYLVKGTKQCTEGVFEPDIRWDKAIARKAIALYARGYIEQMRIDDQSRREEEYERVLARMGDDMEKQLRERGSFNPLEPLHLKGFERTG